MTGNDLAILTAVFLGGAFLAMILWDLIADHPDDEDDPHWR